MDKSVYNTIAIVVILSFLFILRNGLKTESNNQQAPAKDKIVESIKPITEGDAELIEKILLSKKEIYDTFFINWVDLQDRSLSEISNRLKEGEAKYPDNYRFTLEKLRGNERFELVKSNAYRLLEETIIKAVQVGEEERTSLISDIQHSDFNKLRQENPFLWTLSNRALQKGDLSILQNQ